MSERKDIEEAAKNAAASATAEATKKAEEETDDADAAAESGEEEALAIKEAVAAAAAMKVQNDRMESLVSRAEKAAVTNIVSGRARAGAAEQTQEQKEIKMAREILAGSGYEDSLFPAK